MFLKLFLLFTLIPTIEIIILIKLSSVFGIFSTLFLVIGTGLLGAFLARLEGLRVFFKIQAEMRSGKMPARDMLDGLLLLVAGVVLITPGLLTDIMGFVFLFPVTRKWVITYIMKKIEQSMHRGSRTYMHTEYHIQE
jgi:UPF0716 protein FxsA